MRTLGKFLKTTLAGGMLVLFPLFGSAYLLVRLASVLINFIKPLLSLLPGSRYFSRTFKDAAAIIILLLLCFLIGLLVKTSAGKAIGRWVEKHLLSKLPGFALFKRMSQIIFGGEKTSGIPVMVDRVTFKQLGFLVEENGSDELTIFIPSAPGLLSGSVITVKDNAVERLNAQASEVARVVMSYGMGTSALLRDTGTRSMTQELAPGVAPHKLMLREDKLPL